MRKSIKKIFAVASAAALAAGTLALASCGSSFTAPTGLPEQYEQVSSNGGFVVSVGNYYYFINGVETYTSDNTYGAPVKGALMRVKKSELAENNSETVVPSLMVAGDHTAGIYVYGDRVYYATPTNIKNTSGVVENTYLDFASAKLDGTDVKTHFRVATNTVPYRYVEVDGTVYVLYVEGSSSFKLHSYNLKTDTDTTLAENVTKYVFNTTDGSDSAEDPDPWIYYTMGVTENIGTEGARNASYNQIYRVRADATEVPAGYEYGEDDFWDMDYIKEELNGVIPYVNLGELVVDGRGYRSPKTPFSHSDSEPSAPFGYTYTLQSYENGGIYFTRTQISTGTNTTGTNGTLYYLGLEGAADSVKANDALAVVANSSDASAKATASAMFYLDEAGNHHYLYVKDSSIYRVDVAKNGTATELEVAYDIGSATLLYRDDASDDVYDYVYFTRSNGNGTSVERAVYNGDAEDYRNLTFTSPDGANRGNEAYRSVKLLNLQHTTDWYNYEVIGGNVFYADAETFASVAYPYISVASVNNPDGSLMDNPEIEALNDKYEAMTDVNAKTGYLSKLNDEGNNKLSAAIKYFYYTGETKQFYDNIADAVTEGKKDTYLYSEAEQAAFKAFTEGTGDDAAKFKDSAGKSYATYSYFRTQLGKMSEADRTEYENYWKNTGLQRYTPPAAEETGLAWWAWMLIGIAIAVVVAAAACVTCVLLKKRAKKKGPKQEKPHVDTRDDDKDIDVYAVEPTETDGPEEK